LLQLGWFSTGRGPGSRQLLEVVHNYIQRGELDGKIAYVFCNRSPGESEQTDIFFDQVHNYKIPLVHFSSQQFKDRANASGSNRTRTVEQRRIEYDREVMKLLQGYTVDICVLAGYMLIAGDEMCERYKMINLHPAIPGGPKGTWQEVIWNLMENRAEQSGVMIHLATPELDRGPVVTYCTYPITGGEFDKYWRELKGQSIEEIKKEQGENNNLFKLIRKHGLTRELPLIVATLKALCNNDVRIESGRILDKQENPIKGYDLSNEINKMIALEE
jgi:phosphoribosylglycinamide formyltransferase-1